jgi:hypothetical protein
MTVERVSNGTPHTITLRGSHKSNVPGAVLALIARHVPIREAKAAAESAFDGQAVEVAVPMVDSFLKLVIELMDAGFRVNDLEHVGVVAEREMVDEIPD